MPRTSSGQAAPRLRLVKSGFQSRLSELEIDCRHFLAAIKQAGRPAGTRASYARRLSEFCVWMSSRAVLCLADLDRLVLREWGASLYDLPWQPATVRHATAVVRSFLAWCYDERLLSEDLAGCLALPKLGRRVYRTVTADQVEQMLSACAPSVAGVRAAALVSLLFDTGLRASEVCRVRVGDMQEVWLESQRVHFLTAPGKGGNEDLVCFGDRTAGLLRAWIEVRHAAPGVAEIFIAIGGSRPGGPLTRWGIGDIVRQLGRSCGFECGPHDFRRGMATAMTIAGAPTRLTQLAGRWSDVRMVERYTRALELAGVYGRYSPVDRLRDGR